MTKAPPREPDPKVRSLKQERERSSGDEPAEGARVVELKFDDDPPKRTW